MKLVIFLGVLVIFISCFFIFFTFDALMDSKIVCSYGDKFSCNFGQFNMTVIVGIVIIGLFLFVDTLIVYIMLKTWVPDLFMYGVTK
jgi:hypothetical protein